MTSLASWLTRPSWTALQTHPSAIVARSFVLDGSQLTSCYETYLQCVDVSEEGHVRGFYRGIPRRHLSEYVVHDDVVKFTIDTRQDAWIVDCSGKDSLAKCSRLAGVRCLLRISISCLDFTMRGKICFLDPENSKDVVV